MEDRAKTEIKSIAEKNRIVNRITDAILERGSFLLIGHKNPDTDCIASLVSFGLLLTKFNKEITIYLAGPVTAQYSYLLAICRYNGIKIAYGHLPNVKSYSAIVILDSAKTEMIALNDEIAARMKDDIVRKIEIDHHLKGDAVYTGDEGYCLVSEASSTCELIGYTLLKMSFKKDRFKNVSFFTRNISLAIITGIIGDSQIGKYLKTRREKFYYRLFMDIFGKALGEQTFKDSNNFSSMEEIFDAIQNFSVREKRCFDEIMQLKNTGKSVYYTCINREKSEELFTTYDKELVANVTKAVVDTLAEDSENLGMVAYYDDPSLSDFIQFRLRRSTKRLNVDLRIILNNLQIENGGGHPGAIGFRIEKNQVTDIESYMADMVARIEELVREIST